MVDKKPPEGKKSFAESILKQTAPTESGDADDAKKGFTKEWQPAAQAFSLRLWFKDGRHSQGLPWHLYSGDEWHDDAADRPELLTLTFGTRVVLVQGYNLKRLVEQIDEGHLKSIREHDSKEVALIRSEKPTDPTEIKAAIVGINVEPPFEDMVIAIRKGEK
jgi:hypothetical protein